LYLFTHAFKLNFYAFAELLFGFGLFQLQSFLPVGYAESFNVFECRDRGRLEINSDVLHLFDGIREGLRDEQLLIGEGPFFALFPFEVAVLATEMAVVAVAAEGIQAAVHFPFILFFQHYPQL
jgi:hypothetical protein